MAKMHRGKDHDGMKTSRNGSWPLWVAGFAALFVCYALIFVLEPVNSDASTIFLAAQDMVAGNWRLHGWFLPPDSFWGLDDIVFAFISALTHNGLLTFRLVPALEWTSLMFLATYLGTRPNASFQSLAILAALLLIPVFGPITYHFYFWAPCHVLTVCGMLLTVMLCDQLLKPSRGQSGWVIVLAFIIIDCAASDPFFQFTLTLPLLIALGFNKAPLRNRIALGLFFLACVAFGVLLVRLNEATGGFVRPVPDVPHLIEFRDIPHSITAILFSWLGVLGCFPASYPLVSTTQAILRAPLILLLLLPLAGGLRRFWRLEFTDLCLLLIVGSNICALVPTIAIVDITGERFLLPAWVAAAIFAAKFARKDAILTGYCLGIALLAIGYCLITLVHTPYKGVRFSKGEAAYIQELDARGLTRGYGSYWQSSDTTVATGGRIKVAALALGKDGRFGAYFWCANQNWYNGDPNSTRFFVSVPMVPGWSLPEAVTATFGKPDSTFITHNFAANFNDTSTDVITYIYTNRPLPAMR